VRTDGQTGRQTDRHTDRRTNGRGEANKRTGDTVSELEAEFKYLGTNRTKIAFAKNEEQLKC